MEHQDKVAFIRQKTIETNPEIVELKFGCRLHHPGYRMANIYDVSPTGYGNGKKFFTDLGHSFYDDTIKDGHIRRNSLDKPHMWKIIGRPVRLADVLLAIGNHQDKWRETNWFTWVFPVAQELGKSGEWANFCGYSHDKGWALLTNKDKCPVGWNLRADDLEDQSEDTIEFIYSLLK